MVSLRLLLLSAATLLHGSTTASASTLPQQASNAPSTSNGLSIVQEPGFGNQTYQWLEYCREREFSYRGLSKGPWNLFIYSSPCQNSKCTLIEVAGSNIGQNDSFVWTVDVPVNTTFTVLYQEAAHNGNLSAGGLSSSYISVPPSDGPACDQSRLKLPYSAASVSNATGIIGTTVTADSAGQAVVGGPAAKGAAVLALVAAGVAVLL